MSALAILNGQQVADPRNADFMRKSGSTVGITTLAKARGIDLKDKPARKALLAELDEARNANRKFVRQVVALTVADTSMDGQRLKFVYSKKGEFKGVDASFRKANPKAHKVNLADENAALKAKIAALEAKQIAG